MYESSIVQHFAERGRREGIEIGREEGRLLVVLDVINAQFGSNNAEQLKPTLEAIADTTLLSQILIKASQVETFDEFQQEVNTLFLNQGLPPQPRCTANLPTHPFGVNL